MKSRRNANEELKQHWGTDKFVFTADFHIPKNIVLREGSKAFGYFKNFRLNGKSVDFPSDSELGFDRIKVNNTRFIQMLTIRLNTNLQ